VSGGQRDSASTASLAAVGNHTRVTDVIRRWLQANGLVLGFYAALFVLWEAASSVLRIPTFLLPPPSAILIRLSQNPDRLMGHFATTLQEVLLGFALGVVVSIPLGILLVYSRPLERVVYPALVAFQAVPKVALAPILVVWFGFGLSSKIMLGFITAIFPIVINTVIGMNQTPPEMIHLMRSLGASSLQTFLKVRLFVAAPYMFGGFPLGYLLVANQSVIDGDKGLARAFVSATIRGFQAMLDNPANATEIMVRLHGERLGADVLDGQVKNLVPMVVREPALGRVESGAWAQTLQLLQGAGVIDKQLELNAYTTDEFVGG
jgi:ABC-type nitrate/sulfonate/bicarbonate transport system permease component